jgi:hypothetical protein
MQETIINENNIAGIIKAAFDIKKVSLEQNQGFTRFLSSDPIAIRNMRDIVNSKEIQASDYLLFFQTFMKFINR